MISTNDPMSYFVEKLKGAVLQWPRYGEWAFFVWPLERVRDPAGLPFVRVHITTLSVKRMTMGPFRSQPSDMRFQVTFNFLGSEIVGDQLLSGADGLEAYLRGLDAGGVKFDHGSVSIMTRDQNQRYNQVNLSVQCRMIRRMVS